MNSSSQRFQSDSSGQLVRLGKNLYVNRADPLYHYKIIRYLDPYSPESHYRLGQYYEQRGNVDKALYHYRETMKTNPSAYYYYASSAIRRLIKNAQAELDEATVLADDEPSREPLLPPLLKVLLLGLLLLNVLLVVLLFSRTTASRTAAYGTPVAAADSVQHFVAANPHQSNDRSAHV